MSEVKLLCTVHPNDMLLERIPTAHGSTANVTHELTEYMLGLDMTENVCFLLVAVVAF